MVKENPKRRFILINTGDNGRAGTDGGPPIDSGNRRALVEKCGGKKGGGSCKSLRGKG